MRQCIACQKTKGEASFYKKDSSCKVCRRRKHANWRTENADHVKQYSLQYSRDHKNNMRVVKWRLRGIDLDYATYLALKEKQNHRCFICLRHESELGRQLGVDHDHITNKVRGLLCHLCNQALGLLKDNPENFKRAAQYLEESH